MGFLDAIGGFLGGVGSVLADVGAFLEWVYQLVVYVAGVLLNFIVSIANYFLKLFAQVGTLFRHLWDNFFKGLWKRLLHTIKSSQIWNDIRHGHILAFLHDLRKLMDTLFLQYVKPILDMLQHVRQFLLILRALHIKFAQQLDAWIAQVQNQIAGEFLKIRAAVNNVIDLANILADPSLLLRKPTLIASLRRILPALSVVLTRRPLGYWFPSPRKTAPAGQAPVIFHFTPGQPYVPPPASSFLGQDDGLSKYQLPQLGFLSTASAVDDIDSLDYFDDSLYPPASCTDPATCILNAIRVSVPSYGG